MTALSHLCCIGCGGTRLEVLDGRPVSRGVTSDCKPWPRCGTFAICLDCAHTQKIQDAKWNGDIARIYGGYEVYFLSGGGEQVVFDGFQPMPRTRKLLQKLRECVALPAQGTMLDVGCGNGSTLHTFNELYPNWELAGFDITSHSEAVVRGIAGVTEFYTGKLDTIDRKFDLISMVYVVEHLPDPRKVLAEFRRLLKPNGLIWVHTSDFWANPFDLAVVDHSSHFMVDTLAELVERCGFHVLDKNDDWNAKELGVIARLAQANEIPLVDEVKKQARLQGAPRRLRWLGEVVDQARTAAGRKPLGIFGTAIAGTWLGSMTPDVAGFFVDEDRQRVGKTHMGLPVLVLDDVLPECPVYLAFPPVQATAIQTRLQSKYPNLTFIVPPPLAA